MVLVVTLRLAVYTLFGKARSNLGKNVLHPQKYALPYTYDHHCHMDISNGNANSSVHRCAVVVFVCKVNFITSCCIHAWKRMQWGWNEVISVLAKTTESVLRYLMLALMKRHNVEL